MGHGHSKGTNKLAINAMAKVVHFTRDELMELQKAFQKLAHEGGNRDASTITREQFSRALVLVKVSESDAEILDRLFTLFDESGDGLINFKEFVCGVSVILRGTLEERLTFSFHLFDTDSSGKVSPDEMKSVLTAMNNTVSYFGDEKASDSSVDALTKEIFEKFDTNKDGELSFAEYMHAVAEHPVLVSFITKGAGAPESPSGGAGK